MVHGKSRHIESQGSVKQLKHIIQDVENMLTTWTETNKTSRWSEVHSIYEK